MGTKTNKKHRQKNIKIAAIVAGVVLLIGAGFAYRSMTVESPDVAQGKITKDEAKSEPSATKPGSKSSTTTPAMTPDNPVTPPATQSNNLPTPVLAKSSGNNGSIPSGVLVNFTCTSTPGYFCEVKLEKSGANTVTLEKKQLTGEMGQSFASWNWESIGGTWSVTAVLSNSSGQTKSSAPQTLEVR